MGGKVWSDLEEDIYWSHIAPRAPPGTQGQSKAGRMKSWKPLVKRMEQMMQKRRPGQELPRKYTEVSLYEHGFQNLVQKKLSPNAKVHVEKYKALLEKKAENPESGPDTEEPESLEPSVPESSESDESEPSGPSEPAVTVPMGAISQQSTTPQIAMSQGTMDQAVMDQAVMDQAAMDEVAMYQAVMNKDTTALKTMNGLSHQELYIRSQIVNAVNNRIYGSQERPGKRARMMDNSSHDTNMSAREVFPNHNGMPVQQNFNIAAQFPGSQPAYGGYSVQNNMGAAYLGPITGHYGAQNNAGARNNANFSVDYNAAPIDYRGAAGPGLVQNNTNPFMGHQPARMNHGFVTGGGGVLKRKFAYM